MDSPAAVVTRLRPLLVAVRDALTAGLSVSRAVHADRGWHPGADRHLDHQLVRREAMERLRPWGADLDDPLLARQLELLDAGTDNLGLPMSGLILRTPSEVLRVWHSDDGELPAADTEGLRAYYRQAPGRQLQLALDEADDGPRPDHLALLWADVTRADGSPALARLDLVRPAGYVGRRVQTDWHLDLLRHLAP